MGNHHFIWVVLQPHERLNLAKPISLGFDNLKFSTFSAFNIYDRLEVRINDPVDTNRVTNFFAKTQRSLHISLVDARRRLLEYNAIAPPTGTGLSFALKVEQLAYNYKRNTFNFKVPYNIRSLNCSSWVNTLLKVAGVPQYKRNKLNDFSGVDVGADIVFDEKWFQ